MFLSEYILNCYYWSFAFIFYFQVWSSQLVGVASTCRNLHSLALAVAASRPVLLEGPVGAGKTALVEHLANITGRGTPPLLTKLQLGDQTDSKVSYKIFASFFIPCPTKWGGWSVIASGCPSDQLSIRLSAFFSEHISETHRGISFILHTYIA